MRGRKWGIFWLVMLAWNAETIGVHLATDGWGFRAAFDLIVGLWCAFMAYHDLTKVSRTVTITITPDMREWDAAMKRAMENGKRKP